MGYVTSHGTSFSAAHRPHHFYVPFSQSDDFYKLNKRRVVAYVYRRESVWLSLDAGVPQRRVITAAEYRIDVTGASDAQPNN
jgi:hypothetical protein